MARTLLLIICGFSLVAFSFFGCSRIEAETYLPDRTNVYVYDNMTYEEFQDQYELEQGETSLLKDFEVVMKETIIKFNQTNEQHTEDKEFCNIFYDISFRNKTDNPINVYVKCFIPNELYSTIVYSRNSFGTESTFVTVKPGLRSINTAGIIMKHYDKLTSQEKEIYEAYKNDLYIFLSYEDKEYFIKVDDLKVVINK